MKNNPAIAQGRSSLLVSSEGQTTLQPEARSLRASTLSWTKLELNPTDISDLSSLKSDTTAILNAQGNGKIEHRRELVRNSVHLRVQGQKCCIRLALINHAFLINLKHRKEAYQIGQITKEDHKRMAQAAGAQAKKVKTQRRKEL